MRRSFIAILGACVLTVGCSRIGSPQADSAAQSVAEAQQEITTSQSTEATSSSKDTRSESTDEKVPVSEAGIWGRHFDPCVKLTTKQFGNAGLLRKKENYSKRRGESLDCAFTYWDRAMFPGDFLIATVDGVWKDNFEGENAIRQDQAPNNVLDAYTFEIPDHMKTTDAYFCYASVDFSWGIFIVGYGEEHSDASADYLCSSSSALLEAILKQTGGLEGSKGTESTPTTAKSLSTHKSTLKPKKNTRDDSIRDKLPKAFG